jgi:ABC-type transport system involved in cytochrome bd biosynthesis fused ATPase/permease subunit
MTGSYTVAFGPMTLEENWSSAGNGSIAALVRMSGAGKTSMIELIVIEEKGDSLELHLQQWDAGYKARAQGPIRMKLVSITDNSVGFEAVTKGGLKRLGYAKDGDTFTISLVDAQDKARDIPLKAR